ncbi:hypothetical protein D9M71_810010 [compost metagenome]
MSSENIPIASQDFCLFLTYVADAWLSPTNTTAKPGVNPRSFKRMTRSATALRIS